MSSDGAATSSPPASTASLDSDLSDSEVELADPKEALQWLRCVSRDADARIREDVAARARRRPRAAAVPTKFFSKARRASRARGWVSQPTAAPADAPSHPSPPPRLVALAPGRRPVSSGGYTGVRPARAPPDPPRPPRPQPPPPPPRQKNLSPPRRDLAPPPLTHPRDRRPTPPPRAQGEHQDEHCQLIDRFRVCTAVVRMQPRRNARTGRGASGGGASWLASNWSGAMSRFGSAGGSTARPSVIRVGQAFQAVVPPWTGPVPLDGSARDVREPTAAEAPAAAEAEPAAKKSARVEERARETEAAAAAAAAAKTARARRLAPVVSSPSPRARGTFGRDSGVASGGVDGREADPRVDGGGGGGEAEGQIPRETRRGCARERTGNHRRRGETRGGGRGGVRGGGGGGGGKARENRADDGGRRRPRGARGGGGARGGCGGARVRGIEGIGPTARRRGRRRRRARAPPPTPRTRRRRSRVRFFPRRRRRPRPRPRPPPRTTRRPRRFPPPIFPSRNIPNARPRTRSAWRARVSTPCFARRDRPPR